MSFQSTSMFFLHEIVSNTLDSVEVQKSLLKLKSLFGFASKKEFIFEYGLAMIVFVLSLNFNEIYNMVSLCCKDGDLNLLCQSHDCMILLIQFFHE